MIVIQFRQNLLHYRLTEKHCLCTDTEFVTILSDSCHFAIIQIYDLSVLAYKGLLLLFQIFGIYCRSAIFPLLCHLETKFRQS